MKKNGHKWPFSGHILIFFGFVQAVEGSPPYFEGAGCKIASCMHARTTKAQSTASVCTKICYFSWKNCQKWPFLGQKLSILASDRQLQSPPPPPHFEGAGCKKACCVDTPIAQTQFTAFLCHKICHFSTKSAKNSHFFYQNLFVFFSLKQAVEPAPLPIGGCSLQKSEIRQRTT